MTWLTWRQLRTPVTVVGAIVAALGIALVIARPGEIGRASCRERVLRLV